MKDKDDMGVFNPTSTRGGIFQTYFMGGEVGLERTSFIFITSINAMLSKIYAGVPF